MKKGTLWQKELYGNILKGNLESRVHFPCEQIIFNLDLKYE